MQYRLMVNLCCLCVLIFYSVSHKSRKMACNDINRVFVFLDWILLNFSLHWTKIEKKVTRQKGKLTIAKLVCVMKVVFILGFLIQLIPFVRFLLQCLITPRTRLGIMYGFTACKFVINYLLCCLNNVFALEIIYYKIYCYCS